MAISNVHPRKTKHYSPDENCILRLRWPVQSASRGKEVNISMRSSVRRMTTLTPQFCNSNIGPEVPSLVLKLHSKILPLRNHVPVAQQYKRRLSLFKKCLIVLLLSILHCANKSWHAVSLWSTYETRPSLRTITDMNTRVHSGSKTQDAGDGFFSGLGFPAENT